MLEIGSRESRTVVVRLWFEDSSDVEDREWRGEVRDVLNGSLRYFRGMEGLVKVLLELLGDAVPDDRNEES